MEEFKQTSKQHLDVIERISEKVVKVCDDLLTFKVSTRSDMSDVRDNIATFIKMSEEKRRQWQPFVFGTWAPRAPMNSSAALSRLQIYRSRCHLCAGTLQGWRWRNPMSVLVCSSAGSAICQTLWAGFLNAFGETYTNIRCPHAYLRCWRCTYGSMDFLALTDSCGAGV